MLQLLLTFIFTLTLGCSNSDIPATLPPDSISKQFEDQPILPNNFTDSQAEDHCLALFDYALAPEDRSGPSGSMTDQVFQGYPIAKSALWESWAAATELYMPNGEDPVAWKELNRKADLNLYGKPQGLYTKYFAMHETSKTSSVNGNLMSKWGERTFSFINYNQTDYDYVRENKLYHVGGLIDLFNNSAVKKLDFPFGSMETKSMWIILPQNEAKNWSGKYFTQKAVLRQCTDTESSPNTGCTNETVVIGLTGLHIIAKHLPGWFWCTFVHDANLTNTIDDYFEGSHISIMPQTELTAAANKKWKALPRVSGNFLKYYSSVGSQFTRNGIHPNRLLLGSSQLETRFLESSSCITCHAQSGGGRRIGSNQYVGISPFNHKVGAGQNIAAVGYLGNIDLGFFDDNPVFDFKQFDYSWSVLLRAKKKPSDNALKIDILEGCDIASEMGLLLMPRCPK